MKQMLLLAVVVAIVGIPVRAQNPSAPGAASPAGAGGLSQRIVHTDPAAYRPSPAVHGGAGTMSFTALLNRGAVTPEFNFLHRGVIPAGAVLTAEITILGSRSGPPESGHAPPRGVQD